MGALNDLLHSERGLVGIALIISATFLMAINKLTIEGWSDFTRFVFVTYVAGKTVTGSVAIMKGSSDPPGPAQVARPAPSTLPLAPPRVPTP